MTGNKESRRVKRKRFTFPFDSLCFRANWVNIFCLAYTFLLSITIFQIYYGLEI